MKVYLKIKIKSLAAEASIIRQEERKYGKESAEFKGLKLHRIREVRSESRSAQLAYGFLNGKKYRQLENKSHTDPDIGRIVDLVYKYGSYNHRKISKQDIAAEIMNWRYPVLTEKSAA